MHPSAAADPTVVKITTPADILGVLPHRLGFHPTESLVVVCLEGPRRRDRLVMRVDLAPPKHDKQLAREMADRVRRAGASSAVLVCYTDRPSAGDGLARARLVDALVQRLGGYEIGVLEALLVWKGRWWSYHCTDATCCPGSGSPLPTQLTHAASRYAAESVAKGGVVLADRATLVGSIEPPGGPVAQAVRDQAAHAAGEVLVAAIARGGVGAAGGLAVSTLRRLAEAWAGGSRDLTPVDAALVALGLRDRTARDEAMTLVLDHDEGLFVALLTDLVRRVDDVDAAPVCTVLAWAAYAEGGGALAAVAAERALRAEPDYAMAQLVLEGLGRMVTPGEIREVSEHVRADLEA